MSPWWLGDQIDEALADAPAEEPSPETPDDVEVAEDEEDGREPEPAADGESAGAGSDDTPRTSPRRRRRGSRGRDPRSDAETTPTPPPPRDEPPEHFMPPSASHLQPFESLARELAGLGRSFARAGGDADERKIAVFFDFENLALGVRDSKNREKFDVQRVLERLLEKGKIIVKKAYADWERYSEYKRAFHEAAIELIDIPHTRYSGKNSADIKMVVDAIDLCHSNEHLDTFVIVSGDSDFSPLVSKLRENDKHVIGIGVKNSTSKLLTENCDEFIYYEDLGRDLQRVPRLDHLTEKEADVFGLMTEAMLALYREDKDVLWASMVKQTMKRKRPSFAESYFGYTSFSELLEDAERKGIVRLERDKGSGNYRIAGFGARR